MNDERARLPSMTALRAFEVAARHESYTRAAEELNMTQAAVSYQVKLLERQLGIVLFRKSGRQVVLTEEGKRLAGAVIDAFDRVRGAVAAEVAWGESVLSITALPTIASNWLAPRLGAFQIAHPGLALRLDTSVAVADLSQGNFDVALRSGSGRWPGLQAHFLMASTFTVVCAPAVAARRLRSPADLLGLPLYGRAAWWQKWFEAACLRGVPLPRTVDNDLGTQPIEVSAALAGDGAAMVSPAFFADDLARGRLAQPFALVVREPRDYWLTYPSHRAASPKIVAFRTWLLAQVEPRPRGGGARRKSA